MPADLKAASASGSGREMVLYPCRISPRAASTPKARFTELRDSDDSDAAGKPRPAKKRKVVPKQVVKKGAAIQMGSDFFAGMS